MAAISSDAPLGVKIDVYGTIKPAMETRSGAARVSVRLEQAVARSEAMAVRFTIVNDSAAALEAVWYEIEMWDARYRGPLYTQAVFFKVPEVTPQNGLSVDARFLPIGVEHLKKPEEIMMQISVHYDYQGVTDVTSYSRFRAERNADGSYAWFPGGEGKLLTPDQLPLADRPDSGVGE